MSIAEYRQLGLELAAGANFVFLDGMAQVSLLFCFRHGKSETLPLWSV